MQRPRNPLKLSDSLSRQLNAYALAATAAGVSALTVAQPAVAKIIYTRAEAGITGSYPLDLNHDGVVDFLLINRSSKTTTNDHGWSSLYVKPDQVRDAFRGFAKAHLVNVGIYASALPKGSKVGPAERFLAGAGLMGFTSWGNTRGPWCNAQDHYLGLKFHIKGKTHFGWARFNVLCGDWPMGILTGYAYETIPNKPIIAGKTKGPDAITVEPATVGQLARGAAAIPAWRTGQISATVY